MEQSSAGADESTTRLGKSLGISSKHSRKTTSSESPKDKTILIVEDESSVRDTVSRNLTYLGYRILEARNGEEGLAISRNYKRELDLIFTDVVMPRMSGPAMISLIRKDNIKVPVLYTTGYADAPGLSKDDNVLIKPYTARHLASMVSEIFSAC